ncbi:MAG: 16S rRNA (guanine(527)-N(7))-methyltransferase RsmG [Bacilli bacterium]|nr:16S rRNA (guanine(527)-N(7))-methyltransferase RsmG [Bacilli bacterium]
MSKEEFLIELKKLNIIPTEKQLEQLEKYYELLIYWNERINLTRIINKEDVYLKHFYDSLTIVKVVNLNKTNTLLDFGTGAGFPGLVLKIMFPNIKVTLVDSLQKRINFLDIVIKELDLKEITTIHERVENLKNINFDVITTRAVANLEKLIVYTHTLIENNTKFIPLKANVDEELEQAKKVLNKYSLYIEKQEQFFLPKENSIRNILVIEKRNQ